MKKHVDEGTRLFRKKKSFDENLAWMGRHVSIPRFEKHSKIWNKIFAPYRICTVIGDSSWSKTDHRDWIYRAGKSSAILMVINASAIEKKEKISVCPESNHFVHYNKKHKKVRVKSKPLSSSQFSFCQKWLIVACKFWVSRSPHFILLSLIRFKWHLLTRWDIIWI